MNEDLFDLLSVDPTFDMSTIKSKTVLNMKKPSTILQTRKLLRGENAKQAIEGFDKSRRILGFTKGQFSIIELIEELVKITGPCSLVISTWTAATSDIESAYSLFESDNVVSAKWILDSTFQRRKPQYAQTIREKFGPSSVRITLNHAKFVMIRNAEWDIYIETSMNMNFNPRFESFSIEHNTEICDFIQEIVNEIFQGADDINSTERNCEHERRFEAIG